MWHHVHEDVVATFAVGLSTCLVGCLRIIVVDFQEVFIGCGTRSPLLNVPRQRLVIFLLIPFTATVTLF